MENKYTYTQLLKKGYTKYRIKKEINEYKLFKLSRGLYSFVNEDVDIFYLTQMNNKYMVYSNETAAYLLNLTNRYPRVLTVTTKQGYHLRNKNLKIYYVKNEIFDLGIKENSTPFGNNNIVYDKERTICDLIKNSKKIETQIYIESLQTYFLEGKPNYNKLSFYANKLGISEKVYQIVKLYSKP